MGVRFIFLEPGSTTNVSDIVSLTVTPNLTVGTTHVRIVFQSDGETPLLFTPSPIDKIISETGAFQTLYSATSGDSSLVFNFASDAPEPATLGLLGIGLAGIGFARRRKLH